MHIKVEKDTCIKSRDNHGHGFYEYESNMKTYETTSGGL